MIDRVSEKHALLLVILGLDSSSTSWHDEQTERTHKARSRTCQKEFYVIARVWRGIAAPETAHDYLEHLEHTIFPELAQIDGYKGASVLRRDSAAGVEFTVQTLWESMDAIHQFAGDQVEAAVVAPAAQLLFRSYDRTVTHYEVVLTSKDV